MSTKEQYWKYSLIIIIIGLGIILFRQITPFLSGLLGALTIYILVRRQMIYLSEKRKMKRSIAATIITAEAILCFLIPLALVVWLAIINLQNINLDPQAIIAPLNKRLLSSRQKPDTTYWEEIAFLSFSHPCHASDKP